MANVRQKRPKAEAVVDRVVLRPRRQITLSRKVCEALGVAPGDRLKLEVNDGVLTAKPGRQAAQDAIKELRKAIAESGVSLEELLQSGREVRAEVAHEMYPELFPKPSALRRRRRSA